MEPVIPRREVRRIAVFRALMLGDLLNALPALRALRAAYPDARITLIGLPAMEPLVRRFSCVDEFVPFPGYPGLPEIAPDTDAFPNFLRAVQERKFDLALQLHGSGSIVNPLVRRFGARHTAGFVPSAAEADRTFIAWPRRGHEIERLLALTDALGLPRRGVHLEFPLTAAERARCTARFPELAPAGYVLIHPGAQLPSRRWPVERYAQVAAAVAERGLRVAVTGTREEAALARCIAGVAADAIDLSGQTSLTDLGVLIERAALLVCNDTGVSHIAAALGTPSVVVSCGADVERWAPLAHGMHQVLWAAVACRPCAHRVCPTQHECATAVTAEEVIDRVDAILETAHA